jgi:hypothetical protein
MLEMGFFMPAIERLIHRRQRPILALGSGNTPVASSRRGFRCTRNAGWSAITPTLISDAVALKHHVFLPKTINLLGSCRSAFPTTHTRKHLAEYAEVGGPSAEEPPVDAIDRHDLSQGCLFGLNLWTWMTAMALR